MINSFFVLFVFCFFSFPLAQGRVDGVTAIVGNNIVLHSEVLQQSQFVAIEKNISPSKSPYLFEKIYLSTLDNVINQYVVLDVAEKDTNLVVSKDEVDRALEQQIENFIARAGSEELFIKMSGFSSMHQIKSEYWNNIRDMMMVEKYQFSKIQNIDVSRVEVERFFNIYNDSIPVVPEQYSFSVIEVPFVAGVESEKNVVFFLNSLKNKIELNVATFDSLAKIYSHDPGTASLGGFLGFTSRGSLVKEFEEAAYSLSPGEISKSIKTPFGFHLIRLIDRQGEKISTQHILRTVDFSERDKNLVFSSLDSLIYLIGNSSSVFDSIANTYSKQYNNFSGVYNNLPISHIPDFLLSELMGDTIYPTLSSIIKTETGLAIVYSYEHNVEIKPSLDNSWNTVYNYAQQDKQNKTFNKLIEKLKLKTFIKILY